MESAGSPVAFAVGPESAPDLARLFDDEGPFVTVVLATEKSMDNAAQRSLQHWRPVRDALAELDVSPAALDAIEAVVPDAHLAGEGVYVVATDDRVVLQQGLPEAPPRDHGTAGPLPSIVPLIEWRQKHLPHIVVLADRTGADILAFAPGGQPAAITAGDNDRDDPIIRRTAPGGWSQRRYQQRAENTWEANAKQVAERVEQVATLIDPAGIFVAGDTRAVTFLREELDDRIAGLVRHLDGSRAADGSDDVVVEDARKQLATLAAEDTVAILEKFREELGQGDRAVDGLPPTVAALNAASVETLLVHDDDADDRTAWFAPDQPLMALDRATLEGYGVTAPQQSRLADALVRTAFRTGARVRMVPSTVVTDGAGAILRYGR